MIRIPLLALALVLGLFSTLLPAQQPPAGRGDQAPAILIQNVRIFDGIADQPFPGHLLIEGHRIARISRNPIQPPQGAQVLDGGGRVLMPGLTDAHWHMAIAPNSSETIADYGLMYVNTILEAKRTLMRGFTTVREMGGPTFGIRKAIDAGLIPGPRVYPCGTMISQTSGHGDFSWPWDRPRSLGGVPSRLEDMGFFTVADGVPAVLAAVREQLKLGASHVKLAGGGGVTSAYDPLDVTQYTFDEMKAAVEAASDWGTYVVLHVYTPRAIRQALEAGIRSIEHGHLADEETLRIMAAKGAWLSIQPWEACDFDKPNPKGVKLYGVWLPVVKMAKKLGVRVAFGTDLLFDPNGTWKQNTMLTRFAQVYSNAEVLKIATSGNCELFAMSGERNPYGEAKLGVLQEGAWADMLLVEGDPTKDINVLKDYDRNLLVIVKDGVIWKNILK